MIDLVDDGMYEEEWCEECYRAYCQCGYDDDRDDWGCCLGDECLMPSYDHRAGECYNLEMAEAWAEEATRNS
jgi:hypothetical protein